MKKLNYQNKLNEIVSNLTTVPKLLLHSCCGPCSTTCISFLTKYFDITILYYNPNIEPISEYIKRKNEQIKFINNFKPVHKLDFLDIDYDSDSFKEVVKGLELCPEGGARCSKCFLLRLSKTAELAKLNNYDYFGTTLTVSPHKNSKIINEIGESLETSSHVKYLYSDFKKNDGYKESILLSKKYDLYRQEYCGCSYANKCK
ncbi:MAG: epoxyqueuosine reductase QueH [Bacilli bacterium]